MTDIFSFDELDDMEKMFRELGLETNDELFKQDEYDPYDPNRRRKKDELDFDLDDLGELDSLISPDASLEDLFRDFDEFVANRPYLSEPDNEFDPTDYGYGHGGGGDGGGNDFFDFGGGGDGGGDDDD